MRPLNYAILKYFTTVNEASADNVMQALKKEYGHYKPFNKPNIVEALMTAATNGLLEESRYDLDNNGDVRIYFRAHDEGRATINKYIPD